MNANLLKARRRAQTAIERDYGGTITIGGMSYSGAVHLDPVLRVMNDSGNWESRQTLHASILKAQMPTPPARLAVLAHGGISYKVDGEIGGQNAVDVAWLITASRKLPAPS
ncbi:MAG: hypothetical protein Q8M07_04990 [Prosthecobacter sp.]|nr:hypothetical protein [Prosthecobacter sp.]